MKSFAKVKNFLSILNSDALLFLGTRIASIVLSITSIIILCRAVTVQQYFLTDGMGVVYDLIPIGPLTYTIAWSVVALILPGCHRKYPAALDVTLDLLGMAFSFAAGAALLKWSTEDSYETRFCRNLSSGECDEAAVSLPTTEKSGAILLFLTGITHALMFLRACRLMYITKRHYRPSRNSFVQLEKGLSSSSRTTTAHSDVTVTSLRAMTLEQEASANVPATPQPAKLAM